MTRPLASVVVVDLDNTLFDWVETWYRSFNAMLQSLACDSGLPQEELEASFRRVHQRHGTSEYAFAIEELDVLQSSFPHEKLDQRFRGAIKAYREARRSSLRLYPTVKETMNILRDRGCLLIGYTESMAFYTNFRMRFLGLDMVLDFLYSPEDHRLPRSLTPQQVRKYPSERYEYRHTVQRFTPPGELKPNADVLLSILRDCGALRDDAVYVGDSLFKDIAMAQKAGVRDVLAAYGEAQDRPEYDLLRRVTHWTDEDVNREKELLERPPFDPTYVLRKSFAELLDLFRFTKHKK